MFTLYILSAIITSIIITMAFISPLVDAIIDISMRFEESAWKKDIKKTLAKRRIEKDLRLYFRYLEISSYSEAEKHAVCLGLKY